MLSIATAEALSGAELVGDFRVVGSIVDGQLAEHSIAEVDIDDFVVLACWEESIALIVGRGTDASSASLTGLLGGLAWVLDLTNLVPFVLCVAPHVGKCNAIFLEDLHETI